MLEGGQRIAGIGGKLSQRRISLRLKQATENDFGFCIEGFMSKKVVRFVLGAMLLALSFPAQAQQAGKTVRIGYLEDSTATGSAELLEVFRKQMTQFNWVEGKNLAIEYRFGEGKGAARLAELAVELVRLKLDVIVVAALSSALAAKKATSTIPIVMVSVGDPVGTGIIASLAQPEGNITGLAGFTTELGGKRLEILKEAIPKSTRVGVISGGTGRGGQLQVKEMRAAALALGLRLEEIGHAGEPEKLVNAFKTAVRERVHAIITTSGPVIFAERKSIIVLAANYRLPAIYPQKEFVGEK